MLKIYDKNGNLLPVSALASVLGALADAAATGAVTNEDTALAYLKQLITGLALDGTAPHSYDYTKTTVPGWLHGFHMIRRILFVCPETLSAGEPNTAHNIAIKAELDKMGLVQTITQGDALTYPDYESITLTVLGSPLAGTAWTTTNLAHIKAIFGLPIVCVDALTAVYLKMGADGGNAADKTVLNAIANIEASILGIGQDDTTGLATGANTVADSGVTFSTLDMSHENITEVWYAYESVNANTDVLLGEIRKTMPDGTAGVDLDGAEVPGTLAFYGCAYSMDGLNILGKAVFHLLVEKLLHSSTAGLAVLLSGNVGNVVATLGTKSTPTTTGAVSNAKQMMAYVKQLVTQLLATEASQATHRTALGTHDTDIKALLATIAGYIDNEIAAIISTLSTPANFMADLTGITLGSPTNAQLEAARDAVIAAIPAMVGTNGAALASAWSATLATILGNFSQTRIEYLDELAAANLPTDVSNIKTETGQIKTQTDKIASILQPPVDYWSDLKEEVQLDGDVAATIALGTVTIADLPAGATIVRAVAMFKFGMKENVHATIANKLDGATVANTSQVIQVADDTPGTYYDAINFVDDQFSVAAATREGGDVIIGSVNIAGAGKVDANDGYLFRWLLALADEDYLNFNDVQVGLRVWYSV